MNKKEFLAALKRALAVLDETELQDIIDEYEQHIDMKTANGLSEEEAIADFGDFKELTAELLEAYHVRADYAEMNGPKEGQAAGAKDTAGGNGVSGRSGWKERLHRSKPAGSKEEEAGKGFAVSLKGTLTGVWLRLCRGVKTAVSRIWKITKASWIWLWKAFLWCWHQICRPFVWLAGLLGFGAGAASDGRTVPDGTEEPALTKEKGGGRMMGRRSIWAVMGAGIAAFCRGCAEACVWCIRMMWNVFCIGTSVVVGIMGVCFLFAFGMLVILVIGGYPLGGAVIGVLGATVSFFAAAGFVMTLLWRKKRPVLAIVPADAAAGTPAAEPRQNQPALKVQTKADQRPADRTASVIRPESAAGPIAASFVESAAVQSVKPAAPEETEADSREEEKDHA